jgi:hypothetical protein
MDKLFSFVAHNRGTLAFLGLLIAAFLFLRSRPTKIDSLEGLEAMVGNGQPAILEFYSNT